MAELVLSAADLRATLRLANEARELPRGTREQREFVLRELARITSAQVGVWAEVDATGRLFPAFDFGWSGDAERSVFDEYARGHTGLPDDPAVPNLLNLEADPVVVASRQELIGDRAWYRSAHVQELRRAARVDAFLYAGWPGAERFSALSLHRAWGDKPFGERERALVEAVCSECAFLRQPPLARLSPRQRRVLDLLGRGLSEKQIAAELGLSAFTVHDYVKALHRRLRVQSRGELLALSLRARS